MAALARRAKHRLWALIEERTAPHWARSHVDDPHIPSTTSLSSNADQLSAPLCRDGRNGATLLASSITTEGLSVQTWGCSDPSPQSAAHSISSPDAPLPLYLRRTHRSRDLEPPLPPVNPTSNLLFTSRRSSFPLRNLGSTNHIMSYHTEGFTSDLSQASGRRCNLDDCKLLRFPSSPPPLPFLNLTNGTFFPPGTFSPCLGYTHGIRTATVGLRPLKNQRGICSTTTSLRSLLMLNDLQPAVGSQQTSKRLGRGMGSGKGKTAGRGHKGQKSRSGGKPKIGFEGGQTPLRLRLPKRGFHNPFSSEFQVVNLKDVLRKVEQGIIDPSSLITMKTLKDAGLGGKAMRDGIKLLARGAESVDMPLHFEVSRVSDAAKEAITNAGGSVTKVHYNTLGLKALLKPEWFAKKGRLLPQSARPPPRITQLNLVDAVGRLPAPTERAWENLA